MWFLSLVLFGLLGACCWFTSLEAWGGYCECLAGLGEVRWFGDRGSGREGCCNVSVLEWWVCTRSFV